MKNHQGQKHFLSQQESTNSPSSFSGVRTHSPSPKGAIKVLPPIISSKRINNTSSNYFPFSHGPNAQQPTEDPQLYYDGNNYYSTQPSISAMNSKKLQQQSLSNDPVNQCNRLSSVSFDSGRGSEAAKCLFTSSRASIQSYESILSSSSNKDSESSQQSSISSSSTSSSFCSSSSSSSSPSSSCLDRKHSNRTSSPCSNVSSHIDTFASANNVFLKMKPANQHNAISFNTPGMKDSLLAKAGPLTIAEMLLHGVADWEMIHIWLQKINMSQYEKNFIDAAYDMSTISRMNPQDLIAIGITDPKTRSLFTAEIQKLKVPENLPSYKPETLEEWLKLLNLECYYQSLCQQNYTTVDRVLELTWEDLEDVGIHKLGHQKKILLAIKKMKSLKLPSSNIVESGKNYSCGIDSTISKPILSAPNDENVSIGSTVQPDNSASNNHQPYQDVMIKMYGNIKSANSPTMLDRSQIEICSLEKGNILSPQLSQDSRLTMHTFQPNATKSQMNHARRRSLESLNTIQDPIRCSSFSIPTSADFYRPTYQYSNCDLSHSSVNRQTICFENQMNQNIIPQDPNNFDLNYEPSGVTTLNRPKIVVKNKLSHLVPISTVNNCPPLIDSPKEIKFNHSSSDVYASFKKKPPPPPRRCNSIREAPSSVPTTPTHSNFDQSHSLNCAKPAYNFPHDFSFNQNTSRLNENFFASCVKNLTNNFSEAQCSYNKDDMVNNFSSFSKSSTNSRDQKQNRTLPLNKKEMINENLFNESSLNVSSSSSGESMYFAHDNVGTIRQKGANYDFPNNSEHSPRISPSGENILSSFSNDTNHTIQTNRPLSEQSVDSSQNIVDSLEHIEMMLATLKTQLDSIE